MAMELESPKKEKTHHVWVPDVQLGEYITKTGLPGVDEKLQVFFSQIWSLTFLYGGFLKWWYPTTMGFLTKNDHFGLFWGVPPFKETPIYKSDSFKGFENDQGCKSELHIETS